ncbi:MAG: hypothetical protein F6K03_16105, partial [Kamptonema sp. SIO4C4]|nr:hypothetical protein [Kamptonema sp. SIO4C4]
TLEAEIQRQEQQLEQIRQDLPEELETLTETVQSNQRQLQLLRDRLNPNEDTPESNN